MNASTPAHHSRLHFPGRVLTWLHVTWVLVFFLTLVAWVKAVQVAHPTWFGYEPADAQALQQLGLSTGFISNYLLVVEIVWAVALFGMGLVSLWKKSSMPYAMLLSLAIVTLVPGGSAGNILMQSQEPLGWVARFMDGLGMTIAIVALFTFPSGTCVPKWTRWLVLAAILVGVVNFVLHIFRTVQDSGVFWDAIATTQSICALLFLGLGVYALTHRYRKESTSLQRQQIRWLVWGFIIGVAGFVSTNLWFMVIAPALALPTTGFWVSFCVFTSIYTLGFLTMAGALFRALLSLE